MSTAIELLAAIDEDLETAVLTVITNAAGLTDEAAAAPASVHARVLEVSVDSAPRVSVLIDALLDHWRGG
jgi:K+-sensing histidine kinase KdpD